MLAGRGRIVRLRRKRFRAAVSVQQQSDHPIGFTFGPAISLEADVDEAHAFAVQLVDAIDEARRGGISKC